jgi:hypothetical protein
VIEVRPAAADSSAAVAFRDQLYVRTVAPTFSVTETPAIPRDVQRALSAGSRSTAPSLFSSSPT